MLQDGETISHIKNHDPYNLLSDKLVPMHKDIGRVDLKLGNKSADVHNETYQLPNQLPKILSKYKSQKVKYDWNTDKGREYPVYFNK